MVTLADVREAAGRIAPFIHRTPVMTSALLDELAGAQLFFKCENLQKAGAFKTRGAVNAVFSLSDQESINGVATHSSGNHGAALARAAQLRGIPAYIVVPSNARQAKLDAIKSYGGDVVMCEPTLTAREAMLEQVVSTTGAQVIHPYDNERVIAGQGTASLELVDQVPALDALVTPVGGGGLLAGSSLVAEDAGIAIYGAEPEGADDASRSFRTGERVVSHVPDTVCDGLLTVLGERNFEIIVRLARDILLVPDNRTLEAQSLVASRMKLVVEPSSAIVLAAVLVHRELFEGRRVGLVLTGGNC